MKKIELTILVLALIVMSGMVIVSMVELESRETIIIDLTITINNLTKSNYAYQFMIDDMDIFNHSEECWIEFLQEDNDYGFGVRIYNITHSSQPTYPQTDCQRLEYVCKNAILINTSDVIDCVWNYNLCNCMIRIDIK